MVKINTKLCVTEITETISIDKYFHLLEKIGAFFTRKELGNSKFDKQY